MSEKRDLLKIVSNETKKSISRLSVVTPSMYASVFSKYADKNDVDMSNEKDLSQEFMLQECTNLVDLQDQTAKSANSLSSSADKAIKAIENEDKNALKDVIIETATLRGEIQKLKELVYKDELTNTNNRKWLHDNLLNDDATSLKESGTLAIIDLNYFKIVNDTYGHIVGDKVLVFIAMQLKKTGYSVVRYGGDEFLVTFPKAVTQNEANSSLNEIREFILTKKLQAKDSSFKVSFSFGTYSYKEGEELAKVIEIADKNMYDDKVMIKKRVTGI